jgi:two-component system, OmpR family, phosphate regulon sensor histidine kinase PhoR
MLGFIVVTIFLVVFALGFAVWRNWIAPWKEIDGLVRQVGRGEQPRTFLIGGNKQAQRVGVALEEILKRHRDLNRQISERLAGDQAIFSAMQDGLLVVDAAQRVALFNRAFQTLFNLNETSVGAPLFETVRDPKLHELVSLTFQTRGSTRGDLSLGQRQWQVEAVPMDLGNGSKPGVVVLFHDITELKRVDDMRRDFVANVSHELRTPLSILRGYIETMIDDPKMPRGETARILEVMEQHSKRLGLLANDLLVLAQLESGESALQFSEIDLLRFFSDLNRDWEKRISTKNLKTLVDIADDCSTVQADETRLREVFDNLLDNALKYSNKNGELRLQAQCRGNEIALSVIDNGVGISSEDLPRIFERFYRADKARSRELGGTGLGLSIVKHIAQLHGGRVEAESELGKGTTIRVILPTASPARIVT